MNMTAGMLSDTRAEMQIPLGIQQIELLEKGCLQGADEQGIPLQVPKQMPALQLHRSGAAQVPLGRAGLGGYGQP